MKILDDSPAFMGAALAVCCLFLPGCSGGHEALYPVQGKVFLEGKPAERADVWLFPVSGPGVEKKLRPHGVVGPDGSFRISTHEENDGAPEGEYAVTVLCFPPTSAGDIGQANLFPPRYESPKTSGLTIKVQKGRNDLEPFQLSR